MTHQQRRDAAAENGHQRPGDVEAVGKLQGTQTDLFEARRGGDGPALLGGKLVRQRRQSLARLPRSGRVEASATQKPTLSGARVDQGAEGLDRRRERGMSGLAQLGGAVLDPKGRDGEARHRDRKDQEGCREPEVLRQHAGGM